MKRAEKFVDPRSGLEGLIYIVKRTDVEDFEPEGCGNKNLPSVVVSAVKSCQDADDDCVEEFMDRVSEKRPAFNFSV